MKASDIGMGVGLASATAIGCIAYEKLVKAHGYGVILAINFVCNSVYLLVLLFVGTPVADCRALVSTPSSWKYAAVLSVTWCTSILWYHLTRRTTIVNGSLFEVAYLPLLVLIHLSMGESRLSGLFLLGATLVVAGTVLVAVSR